MGARGVEMACNIVTNFKKFHKMYEYFNSQAFQ